MFGCFHVYLTPAYVCIPQSVPCSRLLRPCSGLWLGSRLPAAAAAAGRRRLLPAAAAGRRRRTRRAGHSARTLRPAAAAAAAPAARRIRAGTATRLAGGSLRQVSHGGCTLQLQGYKEEGVVMGWWPKAKAEAYWG